MDESAFLNVLAECPEDDATLLVYADWLDEQGDEARVAFLRAQERSRRLTHSRRSFLRACRETILLGSRLPLEWLMLVSRPRLLGTIWAGADSDSSYYIFRFNEGGKMAYSSPSGDWSTGTWRQIGPLARIEMNFHYADYTGLIGGRRIRGWACNVARGNWTWNVRLTTEEKARANAPYASRYAPRRRRRGQ